MKTPRQALALSMLLALADPAARAQLVEVERSFAFVEGARNLYHLSLPDPLEVRDVASSSAPDACDLGAMSADGVQNAADIVSWRTADEAPRGLEGVDWDGGEPEGNP